MKIQCFQGFGTHGTDKMAYSLLFLYLYILFTIKKKVIFNLFHVFQRYEPLKLQAFLAEHIKKRTVPVVAHRNGSGETLPVKDNVSNTQEALYHTGLGFA